MSDATNRFYNSINGAANLKQSDLIDLFVYFLTVDLGESSTTTNQVKECFVGCDLQPPAGIAVHFSRGLKTHPAKFVKVDGGYRLQRHMKEALAKKLGAETVTVQTSIELRRLEASFPEGSKKDFLKETIDCFEAKANRAAIVMCWILTLDHLFEYILSKKLAEFNTVLSKNTDKRIKVKIITKRDDFTEIPESKFIEFCRSAVIISNDVRKILDQKLGTRNSAAHPSGIVLLRSKVIDFIEDLVTNVILKYKV